MAEHTPGPWRWELNEKYRSIDLCGGVPRHDLTVMDFVRYGMQNAAPRFREPEHERLQIMHRAEKWAAIVPGREHHADWFKGINHPDAHLIAAAPCLLAACEAVLSQLDYLRGPWSDAAITRVSRIIRAAVARAKGEDA